LTQTLLQLRRRNIKVSWFGAERDVPLPAGITLNSPWLDLSQSMPSWSANQKWDYLPPPRLVNDAQPPPDHLWPADPPRRHLYVDDAYLLHPLVSAQLNHSWAGTPPVWICCGWECLTDEDKYFVSKLRADGVPVVFEEYEAMPHVFAVVLPKLAETERCVQGWARFITSAMEDPESIKSSITYIKAKTLEESEGDAEKLTPYEEKDVFEMAYKKVGREVPSLPLVSSKL
jgi:hypothetical protein